MGNEHGWMIAWIDGWIWDFRIRVSGKKKSARNAAWAMHMDLGFPWSRVPFQASGCLSVWRRASFGRKTLIWGRSSDLLGQTRVPRMMPPPPPPANCRANVRAVWAKSKRGGKQEESPALAGLPLNRNPMPQDGRARAIWCARLWAC